VKYQKHSLSNKQKHDGVKRVTRRILENEARSNPDGVNARQAIPNLHPEHAQTNKEQNHKRKEQ